MYQPLQNPGRCRALVISERFHSKDRFSFVQNCQTRGRILQGHGVNTHGGLDAQQKRDKLQTVEKLFVYSFKKKVTFELYKDKIVKLSNTHFPFFEVSEEEAGRSTPPMAP